MEIVPKYKRNLLKWSADPAGPGQAKVQLIAVGQEYSHRNIDFVNGKAGSSTLF
jgi:hypothetical protein